MVNKSCELGKLRQYLTIYQHPWQFKKLSMFAFGSVGGFLLEYLVFSLFFSSSAFNCWQILMAEWTGRLSSLIIERTRHPASHILHQHKNVLPFGPNGQRKAKLVSFYHAQRCKMVPIVLVIEWFQAAESFCQKLRFCRNEKPFQNKPFADVEVNLSFWWNQMH